MDRTLELEIEQDKGEKGRLEAVGAKGCEWCKLHPFGQQVTPVLPGSWGSALAFKYRP